MYDVSYEKSNVGVLVDLEGLRGGRGQSNPLIVRIFHSIKRIGALLYEPNLALIHVQIAIFYFTRSCCLAQELLSNSRFSHGNNAILLVMLKSVE